MENGSQNDVDSTSVDNVKLETDEEYSSRKERESIAL